jgi:hypothetical protein
MWLLVHGSLFLFSIFMWGQEFWSYTLNPTHVFMVSCLIKHRDDLTFLLGCSESQWPYVLYSSAIFLYYIFILCVYYHHFFLCFHVAQVIFDTFTFHDYFILILYSLLDGAGSSIVGWGTMLQAGRSRVRFLMSLDFSIYLILTATLWPWGQVSL